ncbi:MAG: 2-oxoacid:ferredoxin oxidoreductase subunit beta, partial [Gammaproteobacteria bacterium]|nr:2-oxoacid:ferredoxin oxidoreductase subunit beta [Gammaproteobacteria bacterium]
MSYIAKPNVTHPKTPRNKLGLTSRDYEGAVSTLCAGCGHDSITAAIIQAVFELDIEPHMLAKMSGIGCSSKTPAYFVSQSHGFNSVHGRMPSVTTGANAANRDLCYIGVSGDGDSLSIGMGQFAHVIRRNLDMCYVIENNGVYGLTKGQYSASADVGSTAKKGAANRQMPIDPVSTAIGLGATYIARGFSGDKQQLVPLIKAALSHNGFALIDVISPCVTFNDHAGSTKSYAHTREYYQKVVEADYVPTREEIKTRYDEGDTIPVEMHDGSHVILRKVDRQYDPTSRAQAYA